MSMKVYTKTGDDGTTSLYGAGEIRFLKHNPQVALAGILDETIASIGLLKSFCFIEHVVQMLNRTIRNLFEISAEVSAFNIELLKKNMVFHVNEEEILLLEKTIDNYDEHLSELSNFIYPGPSTASAQAFIARSLVRKAERELIAINVEWGPDNGFEIRPEVIKYINRLSDFLFVLARYINHYYKDKELEWIVETPEK